MRPVNHKVMVLLVAVVTAGSASSGVIYLKDGFAVHGSVRKEMELVIDPATGQPVPMFKASPQFLLDDRARYVVFGPKQVESADKDKDIRDGHGVFQAAFTRAGNKTRPAMAVIGQAGPFNDKWERSVAITVYDDMMKFARPGDPPINDPTLINGRYKQINARIRQKITLLSPYFVRVECFEYDWTSNYLTDEFGPAVILPLLRTHPEVATKPDAPADFDRQFRVLRFCMQAGWYREANQELTTLRGQFPGMKDRLDQVETGLKQLVVQQSWDAADRASKAGRHSRAQEILKTLNIADLPPALQLEASNMQVRYDNLNKKMEQCRAAVAICYDDFVGPPVPVVAQAMPVIARELNLDVLDRLEPFTALGRQFELDVRAGKQPQYTADQVLCSAISGWVLGPAAAEASEAAADRLWRAREWVLDLQRTAAPIDRTRKLASITESLGITVDECARMITLLPPPENSDSVGPNAGEPIDRQTRPAFTQRSAYSYKVALPPEYHPNRSYPLLVVLPNVGETTAQAIRPWLVEGARYGFIVAAVDWATARNRYEYRPDEQFAAVDCLRDIQRSVQVDSDRVFLTGNGEGGNAAIDVGLSHPDLFAGVVPMNGRPRWYVNQWYWRNAQVLPFYVVIGELSGDVRPWIAALTEKWIEKGYQSLLVMYRGRPTDFFSAEVPNIFDWMSRKRRALGFPELGRSPNSGFNGEEFHSFRPTDDRFYWASSDAVNEKFTISDLATTRKGTPAAIQANIRDGNQVTAFTRGLKQLTLWFGRVYDPQTGARDMIDFSKPVRVTLNGRQSWSGNGKPLTPRMDVLLEDFCRRGDRKRLFFAKVEFDKIQQ